MNANTPPRAPSWARPAVAAGLAVVLAVTGAIVGATVTGPTSGAAPLASPLAPPTVVPASPAVQLAPESVPADAAALETLFASPELIPGLDEPTPSIPTLVDGADAEARASALLDIIASAPDPQAAADTAVELLFLDPIDDACADPEVPAECPEGIRSTVQAQTIAEELRLTSVGLATTSPSWRPTAFDDCEADPDFAPKLRIVSTVPITVQLAYWPRSVPGASQTVTTRTSVAATRQWLEQRREASGAIPAATCVELSLLAATQIYDLRLTAWVNEDVAAPGTPDGIDAASRAITRTISFNSAGTPEVPASEISMVRGTSDLVIASIPLKAGERVDFFAKETELAVSFCEGERPSLGRVLQIDETRIIEVSPDSLLNANLQPDFTRRAIAMFALPEGITTGLCVVTFDGDRVARYATSVIRVADRLTPTISLHSVSANLDPAERLTVQGYLSTGEPCGSWTSAGARQQDVYTPPVVLCEFRERPGSIGIDPGTGTTGQLPGSLGRFTFTLDDNLRDDAATAKIIDLDRLAPCFGACTPPPDSFHVLRWFDSASEQSAYVIAQVSWDQGASNGVLESVASPVQISSDGMNPDLAYEGFPFGQLEESRLAFAATGYDSATRSASASATLISTKPGSYRAMLLALPGTGPLCTLPGANTIREGRLGALGADGKTAPVSVQFDGLCAGGDYALRVVLTDDDGEVTTWGGAPNGPAAQFGFYIGSTPSFELRIPPVELPLRVRWLTRSSVQDPAGRGFDMTLTSVAIDRQDVVGPLSPLCMGGLPVMESTSIVVPPVSLSERMTITGRVSAVERCDRVRILPNDVPLVFESTITLEQLLASPSGVLVRFSPPPGSASVTRGAQTISGWVQISPGE